MMIIELPEGGWVDAESIVACVPTPPESEYELDPTVGCSILLSSGHSVPTEETPERILVQMAELAVAARELETDGE